MPLIPIPNPDVFEQVDEHIVNDINTWLKDQGHEFEYDLEKSIKLVLAYNGDTYTIGAEGLDYIFDLEYGVSPEEMSKKAVDVDKLDRWVKFRRSQGHATPGVNRLIKLWSQRGFELQGAILYSNKPRVNLAITDTLETYEADYFKQIDDIVFDYLDIQFSEVKEGKI